MAKGNSLKGAKVSIGPVLTAPITDQAGFDAVPFVEIGGVGTIGNFGPQDSAVTYDLLSGDQIKLKGVVNVGDPEMPILRDLNDAGQNALRIAAATDDCYPIAIERADKPDAGGTNSIFYCQGTIMRGGNNGGGAGDVDLETYTLGLSGFSNDVVAAAGP